jgi:cyclohexanecarboxylate-CoA ligase/acyl-CoA synthetase
MTLGVMAPTIAGAAIHLLDVFTAEAAMQRIRDYGCTGTASPAPIIKMILDQYDPAQHDLSRLRFWLLAGAPIPGMIVDTAARLIPSCRLISAYGSSEVMMATVCRPGDPVERVLTSDGTAVPGVEIRITDAHGNPVPTGVDGEICYRGPGRLLEYWGRPDLTAAATDDEGWWRTGDVGHLDDRGYLRVTGRLKDIIIRGGFNISALEVEEALLRHALIANVAVIGIPDPTVGERACAVIVLKDPRGPIPDLKDLRDFLHTTCQIAIWKVPERIEILDELPITTTGKVQKFALRKRFTPVDPRGN